MVASDELPRKPLCEIVTDADGSRTYIVGRSPINTKVTSQAVTVWWNRNGPLKIAGRKYYDEVVFLRQQETDERADVITLTLAQCYEMLDAISRAIESR
jgi:hypothetical protein